MSSKQNSPNHKSEDLKFIQEILAQSRQIPKYLHSFIVILYIYLGIAALVCHFLVQEYHSSKDLAFFDLYWVVVAVIALGLYLGFRKKYRQPGEQLTHMIERRGRTYFLMVVLALFILNIFYYNGIINEKLHIMPFVMLGFGMSAPILSLRVFSWDLIVGLLWYVGAIITVISPALILGQFMIFAILLFICAFLYSIKFHREAIH